MADIVRLSKDEMETSAARMESKLDALRNHINQKVQSTVSSMDSWWIGNAYEAFKADYNTTKTVLESKVMAEIEDYISRLRKAVNEQIAQDEQNSGTIGIN